MLLLGKNEPLEGGLKVVGVAVPELGPPDPEPNVGNRLPGVVEGDAVCVAPAEPCAFEPPPRLLNIFVAGFAASGLASSFLPKDAKGLATGPASVVGIPKEKLSFFPSAILQV